MAPNDLEKRGIGRGLLRIVLLVLVATLVSLGAAGWLARVGDRIRPGMTRAEVDEHLGPPDGKMLAVGGTALKETVLVWNDRGIVIEFDEENRVREVKRPPNLLRDLRKKFGF